MCALLERSADASSLNEFDQLLYECEMRRRQLDIAFQQNERQSLSLGLVFIDSDGKGFIEPQQAAELTAKLWATIDMAKRNQISADDLQRAIQSLSDQLEQLHHECRQIEAENAAIRRAISQVGELQLQQNERRLNDLNRRREEIRRALTGIYSFFHRAFGRLVFAVTEDEVPNHSRVDLADLIRAIDKVIFHNRIDPLVESEQKFVTKLRSRLSPKTKSPSKTPAQTALSRQHSRGTRTAFLGLGIDYERNRKLSVSAATTQAQPETSTTEFVPFNVTYSPPEATSQYKREYGTHSLSTDEPSRHVSVAHSADIHRFVKDEERTEVSTSRDVVFHKDQDGTPISSREAATSSPEALKSLPPLQLDKAEDVSPPTAYNKETYSPGHPLPRQSSAEFEKQTQLDPPQRTTTTAAAGAREEFVFHFLIHFLAQTVSEHSAVCQHTTTLSAAARRAAVRTRHSSDGGTRPVTDQTASHAQIHIISKHTHTLIDNCIQCFFNFYASSRNEGRKLQGRSLLFILLFL